MSISRESEGNASPEQRAHEIDERRGQETLVPRNGKDGALNYYVPGTVWSGRVDTDAETGEKEVVVRMRFNIDTEHVGTKDVSEEEYQEMQHYYEVLTRPDLGHIVYGYTKQGDLVEGGVMGWDREKGTVRFLYEERGNIYENQIPLAICINGDKYLRRKVHPLYRALRERFHPSAHARKKEAWIQNGSGGWQEARVEQVSLDGKVTVVVQGIGVRQFSAEEFVALQEEHVQPERAAQEETRALQELRALLGADPDRAWTVRDKTGRATKITSVHILGVNNGTAIVSGFNGDGVQESFHMPVLELRDLQRK